MLRLYDDYGNVYDLQEHDAKVRADVFDEVMQYIRLHRKYAEYQSDDFVFYHPLREWLEWKGHRSKSDKQ